MCLGIPGKVTELYETNNMKMAKVDFGGVVKEACMAYLPEITLSSLESISKPCYYVYRVKNLKLNDVKTIDIYKKHGVLYNLIAAKSACPSGWHLP